MRMIAISGKMGAGKDTVGDMIKDHYSERGKGVERLKCANMLYKVAYMLGMSPDKKDREFLLYCGQKAREWNKNFFVEDVINRQLQEAGYYEAHVVYLTDMRFKNEFDSYKAAGFELWRIEASEEIRKPRAQSWVDLSSMSEADRLSETELDGDLPWDVVIVNEGSLKELQKAVKTAIYNPSFIPVENAKRLEDA